MATYAPPLTALIAFGDPDGSWPDYVAQFGLTPDHIPALIRLMQDDELYFAEKAPDYWAAIHAWRALGQLRATAAVEPLLGRLHLVDDGDNDWISEEIPEVLGLIGPAAQSATIAYFLDEQHGLSARINAVYALLKIAEQAPETRPASIAACVQQLEHYATQDVTLNEFLVYALMKLHAVEATPLLEKVFAGGYAEGNVGGDWEDIQIEWGLLEKRTKPRRFRHMEDLRAMLPEIDTLLKTRPPGPPPGRNDRCWCGSGKKYKLCHWATDEAAAAPQPKKKRRR